MDLVQYVSGILGSVVVGTAVGTISNLLLPTLPEDTDDSAFMGMTKEFLYIAVKAGINVYVMYQASRIFLQGGDSDPTNGSLMLTAMLFADHSLWNTLSSSNKSMAQAMTDTMAMNPL